MSAADWLILAIVVLSVALAAAQGFFLEIFSLAGVVLGYLLAAWNYQRAAGWYAPYVSSAWVGNIAGFLTIFLAVVVLAGMAGRLARWGLKEAGLRWFDRLLGAAFGLVRGLLVATVLALALAAFAPGSAFLARSSLAPYLLVGARAASWVAPGEVRQQLRSAQQPWRDGREEKDSALPAQTATRPMPMSGTVENH